MVTYEPLGADAIEQILDLQLETLQRHVYERLGPMAFTVTTDDKARACLIEKGTSLEFGARELKRTIQRSILQPIAGFVSRGGIPPVSTITITMNEEGDKPVFLLSPGTRNRSPRAA